MTTPVPESTSSTAPRPATKGDTVLLVAFWAWAAALVLLTLAQLFHWQGVLDVLDVKRWFDRTPR